MRWLGVYLLFIITLSGYLFYTYRSPQNFYNELWGGYVIKPKRVQWVEWRQGFYLDAPRRIVKNLNDADPTRFTILDFPTYAKDGEHGYYRGASIQAADVSSFKALSRGFAADNAFAYYRNDVIEGSHGPTHVPLDGRFSKDQNDIFVEGRAIGACDPMTARKIDSTEFWVIDNQCAYYIDLHKFPIKDSATFELLGASYGYAKDRYSVYYKGRVISSDPDNFESVRTDHQEPSLFWRDRENLYLHGKIVEGVEIGDFKYFGAEVYSDAGTMFSSRDAISVGEANIRLKSLEGADPNTALLLNRWYWRDDDQAFFKAKELTSADVETLVTLHTYYWAKDQFRVYYNGETLEGADAQTFEVIGMTGKDKNGCWDNMREGPFPCEIIETDRGYRIKVVN
jgi:hypothetical protein